MSEPRKVMVVLAIVVGLTMGGCDKPMTNDQIIQESAKCKAAGLKPILYTDGWDWYKVTYVQCEEK